MPSAKILSEKQAYVADLKAKLDASVAGVIVTKKYKHPFHSHL